VCEFRPWQTIPRFSPDRCDWCGP